MTPEEFIQKVSTSEGAVTWAKNAVHYALSNEPDRFLPGGLDRIEAASTAMFVLASGASQYAAVARTSHYQHQVMMLGCATYLWEGNQAMKQVHTWVLVATPSANHFYSGQHSLFIVMQHQGQDVDHPLAGKRCLHRREARDRHRASAI